MGIRERGWGPAGAAHVIWRVRGQCLLEKPSTSKRGYLCSLGVGKDVTLAKNRIEGVFGGRGGESRSVGTPFQKS